MVLQDAPSAGDMSIHGARGLRVVADGNVICAPTKQKVRLQF